MNLITWKFPLRNFNIPHLLYTKSCTSNLDNFSKVIYDIILPNNSTSSQKNLNKLGAQTISNTSKTIGNIIYHKNKNQIKSDASVYIYI